MSNEMRDAVRTLWAAAFGLVLVLAGLSQGTPAAAQVPASSAQNTDIMPRAVETHELHNVWRLSGRVLSGSEPEDDAAFAELVGLGVKTIVSVDGIAPPVELAKKHGLRYVHIPIGYDGIPVDATRALARVARDIPGTVYVHCHHGKHRGPAAAAVLCRADDGRSAAGAQMILEKAGTGREYPGLWRSVADFRTPPSDAELPELAERAPVESLASAMAKLDRIFERLKTSLNDTQPRVTIPNELSAAQESLQLAELFVESARLSSDGNLREGLESAAQQAKELSLALAAGTTNQTPSSGREQVRAILARIGQSCTACHRQHRN